MCGVRLPQPATFALSSTIAVTKAMEEAVKETAVELSPVQLSATVGRVLALVETFTFTTHA